MLSGALPFQARWAPTRPKWGGREEGRGERGLQSARQLPSAAAPSATAAQVANARKCTRYAVVEERGAAVLASGRCALTVACVSLQERGMAVLCDASGFSADASSILVAMLEPNPARYAP